MEPELSTYFIVCPLVFLGGFLDAIAGGGGLVSLPAYVLAGVPIHNAIATNKLSSVPGACVSALRYWKHGFVTVGFIIPSVIAALVGSALGARLALVVDEAYMKYLLIIVLPVAAFVVLKHKTLDNPLAGTLSRERATFLACAISLTVGAYDGFYGPGTGTFLLLLYCSIVRMDVRNANGNAKVVNFASNLGAFAAFVASGKMLVALGVTAALFSMAGHWAGSGLAIRKGSSVVRPVVLVVLALLFVKVVIDGG